MLEQHLETMRATYQLNAEKLEYNYRVLLERDAGGWVCRECDASQRQDDRGGSLAVCPTCRLHMTGFSQPEASACTACTQLAV